MKVYQSISLVSAELAHAGISKDRSNQQQGYKFRGIDDCLNALAPLLSRNNLVILPEVIERETVERQTRQGGALFYVTVKVRFAFVNVEDASRHDVVTYGEAMDSADKATNKAMSAAYKYAVIQAFCIPTEGENDADAVTHDVAAKKAQAVIANKQTAQAKIAALRTEGIPIDTPLNEIAPEAIINQRSRMQEPARQDGGVVAGDGAEEKAATHEAMRTQKDPDAAAPFIWRLGKHKNKAIIDPSIDIGYLSWAAQNASFPDHKQAALDEIDRRQKQDHMNFEAQG